MGKNGKAKKQNGITKSITKVMDGVRTAISVNPRLDAAIRREQAARPREELLNSRVWTNPPLLFPRPRLKIVPIGRPVRK